MKKFDRDGKINFVDDNNSFIGFSDYQCCCESFGWMLTKEPPKDICEKELSEDFLEDAFFDPKADSIPNGIDNLDSGDAKTFLLKSEKHGDMFLTFYNSHNGYYSHGLEGNIGGVKIDTSL